MYNDADRRDDTTLAATIRRSFMGETPSFTKEQATYSSFVSTSDLLDFSRVDFNKALRLNAEKKIELKSKYPLSPLGTICKVTIGGTPSRKTPAFFYGDNLWVSIAEMNGEVITDTKEKITNEAVKSSNVKLIPKGTTLLSFKLSIGKTAIAGADLYTNEAIAALIPQDDSEIINKYLFFLFKARLIDFENVGNKAFGKSLNSTYLKEEVKIPVPPRPIQQKLVDECSKVDEEYKTTRMSPDEYLTKLKSIFYSLNIIIPHLGR